MNRNNIDIKNRNYILSFDGLRAFAVTFVMLYHLSPHIFSGGYLGVVIFLVLSGYLVTDNFIKEMDKSLHIDILKFWKKRLLKLYIPLLPCLSIVSLLILFFFSDMLNGYVGNLLSSLLGMNNIYQIVNGLSYFESHGNLNPFTHLWSLGLEMQFYFIWPVILSFLYGTFKIKGKKLAITILSLSLLSAYLMYTLYNPNIDVSRIYYGTDTRAFAFLVGAFFAILFPRNDIIKLNLKIKKNLLLDFCSVIIFLIIVYLSIVLSPNMPIVYNFGMYAYSVLIGTLLILILLEQNIMNKFLSLLPFTIVGRRSYSLYLWQYPIMIFISSKLSFTKISKINLFILELIISVLIAEFSYRFFENKKNYLRYVNKNSDIVSRNMSLTIFVLTFFVLFSTSISSLSKSTNEINDLKERISEIEKIKDDTPPNKKNIKSTKKLKDDISKENITFIGDSVMLCAVEDMKKTFENSVIDAKVSRQSWDLQKVIDELKEKNLIKDIVVIHLGTNYKINKVEFENSLKSLENRKIILINCIVPESWEEQVNQTLKEISEENENIELIDWYNFAKEKKELFYKDATHPNIEGAKIYNNFLKDELNKIFNKQKS